MGKPSKEEVLERERQAWQLRVEGKDQAQIATLVGIQQPGVSKLLKRVSARVAREMAADVAAFKTLQTERLERVYSEAFAAWLRAQEGGKDGNPALLDKALAALAQLAKLWGLNQPDKVAPTTPDGDLPWDGPGQIDKLGPWFRKIRELAALPPDASLDPAPPTTIPGGDSP